MPPVEEQATPTNRGKAPAEKKRSPAIWIAAVALGLVAIIALYFWKPAKPAVAPPAPTSETTKTPPPEQPPPTASPSAPSSPGSAVARPTEPPPTPIGPSTQGHPAPRTSREPGPAIHAVRAQGDVVSPDGLAGIRIEATTTGGALARGAMRVVVLDEGDRPVHSRDPRLATSDGQLAVTRPLPSRGAAKESVAFFVPYAALDLKPGTHTLHFRPELVDSDGKWVTKGPVAALWHLQGPERITRLHVDPNAIGPGGRAVRVDVEVVADGAPGRDSALIVHFRDGKRNVPLPARDRVHVDAKGMLAAASRFRTAGGSQPTRSQVLLPFDLLPRDLRELTVEVALYDPVHRQFMTTQVHTDVPIRSRGASG